MNEEYKAAIGAGIFISIIIAAVVFVIVMSGWVQETVVIPPEFKPMMNLLLFVFLIAFSIVLFTGGVGGENE